MKGTDFPAGSSSPEMDADGDGTPNAFEWLFGTDPVNPGSTAQPEPTVREVASNEFPGETMEAGQYLSLTAEIRKNTPGMTVSAQAAESLEALSEPDASDDIISHVIQDLGDFEQREWIWTVPMTEAAKGFIRLKAAVAD